MPDPRAVAAAALLLVLGLCACAPREATVPAPPAAVESDGAAENPGCSSCSLRHRSFKAAREARRQRAPAP